MVKVISNKVKEMTESLNKLRIYFSVERKGEIFNYSELSDLMREWKISYYRTMARKIIDNETLVRRVEGKRFEFIDTPIPISLVIEVYEHHKQFNNAAKKKVEKIGIENFSDQELADELRKRGFELMAEKRL